jgi:hypothetical protein
MGVRIARSQGRSVVGVLAAGVVFLFASAARAQTLPPERSGGLQALSTVAAAVGVGTQILMPRIYYADSESTVGWKARWHASAAAPVMTLTTLTLLSEFVIKPEAEGFRPGCDDTNIGARGCRSFGMPSTHSLAAFSALGQGTGVFLVDTLKWNEGRFNGASLALNVVLPLVAAGLTAVGRVAGDPAHESGGQMLVGAGVGLGTGLLFGGGYALLQAPGCGYGAGVFCW